MVEEEMPKGAAYICFYHLRITLEGLLCCSIVTKFTTDGQTVAASICGPEANSDLPKAMWEKVKRRLQKLSQPVLYWLHLTPYSPAQAGTNPSHQ